MMQTITTVGLDIAKSVFQVHGVDARGEAVLRRQLRRAKMLPFFAKLPPCIVGIEACASSHHWARELLALGHTVRLMPPAYVKPFVKRQKNGAADAEAICEAVQRPSMRFVSVKTPDQQASHAMSRRLDELPGIGPALAPALIASVPDAKVFRSGRDFSAWIGLVPKQNSSGGKERLGGITKQGDRYLRSLFTAGALAVIRFVKIRGSRHRPWLTRLLEYRPAKVAAIALANKIARMAWAMMAEARPIASRRRWPDRPGSVRL
jgi:transposase